MTSWEEARRRCDAQRWEVSTERVFGCIKVEAHRGMIIYRDSWGGMPGAKYVYPPNFIERLLGITFEEKVAKAQEWCKKFCERENSKEDAGRLVCELRQSKDGEP